MDLSADLVRILPSAADIHRQGSSGAEDESEVKSNESVVSPVSDTESEVNKSAFVSVGEPCVFVRWM